ncbi:MAG: cysteine hydrolase [Nocardioidaceae bacterium]|nr:cysteine hydrolase [Nocardioidaceae bacterium]
MTTYDPRRTGLVVFDMLEAYREPIEQAGSLAPTVRLVEACRELGVPVFFARADHRADGADLARSIADTDNRFRPWGPDNPVPTRPPHGSGSPGLRVLAELDPRPEDYDVPKHRWSAFHGTHLELSLRSRGIDHVLLVGGSVHVGIASTAYAARDADFQVTVVPDCCHGFEEQRSFFMTKVFPRMCHVLGSADVLDALREG